MSEEFRASLVGISSFFSGVFLTMSFAYRFIIGNFGDRGGYGVLLLPAIGLAIVATIMAHVRRPEDW